MSFGWGRAEVLAALVNAVLMLVIVIGISIAAFDRLRAPQPVQGGMVMGIAAIGLLVNIAVAWVLHRGEQTLNIRGALLHVMGDLLGSVAALVAGAVIYFTGWTPIDPLLSVLCTDAAGAAGAQPADSGGDHGGGGRCEIRPRPAYLAARQQVRFPVRAYRGGRSRRLAQSAGALAQNPAPAFRYRSHHPAAGAAAF
jgi:hypothetical protein